MMKEEFDFDKVGKRMPYKVPAGSLDTVTNQILAAVEIVDKNKQQLPVFWRASLVAASVAALLLAGYFLYIGHSGNPKEKPTIAIATSPPATTPDSPAPAVPAPDVASQPAQPPKPLAAAKPPRAEMRPAQTQEQETLEELLDSMTDEDLLQLTAMVRAEEYVIEQTVYE